VVAIRSAANAIRHATHFMDDRFCDLCTHFFGIFYVPYISLNADLTTSYEERTMLSTLRIFLEKLAGIVMGFVILLVFLANAPDFPDGRLRTRPVTQRWALWAVLLQSCQF